MPTERSSSAEASDVDQRLLKRLRRHLDSAWRQPLRAHTCDAFQALRSEARLAERLVLDSGCGTGWSTARLAERFPDCLVIGIDKSAARLSRQPRLPANARLLRAELSDFWRLAVAEGWRLQRHFLLYPNPWPKPGHLGRRWHAHPVFPVMLALGGTLELRCNTESYAREFLLALHYCGVEHARMVSFEVDQPLSLFERKYALAGQTLFKVTALSMENPKT